MEIRLNGTQDEILEFCESLKLTPGIRIKQVSKLYENRKKDGYDLPIVPTYRCYITLDTV